MELSSLFDDFGNHFQNNQIEAVKNAARMDIAQSSVKQRKDLMQLAKQVEQRIQEVERDNAILGMLVLRLLKHVGETQPKETEAIIHDVREILNSSTPAPCDLDFLRQSLNFPPLTKSDVPAPLPKSMVQVHVKPRAGQIPPKPLAGQAHGKAPTGPAGPAPRKLPQPPPPTQELKTVKKSPAAPKSPPPPKPPVVANKTVEETLPSAFPK